MKKTKKILSKILLTIVNSLVVLGLIGMLFTVHTNTIAEGSPSKKLTIAKGVEKLKRFSNKISKASTVLPSSSTMPEYVMVNSRDTTTFSSETAATVIMILSKEGDEFRAGDILIEFDCRSQQADLKKAKAQQESASSAFASAEKMESYGSISQFELIKAKSEAAVAGAEVDKLNALVDKCVIKAPYNGAVSQLLVHIGEAVKPGDPLLKIVNNENLELQMQIPSAWLQWLHVGSLFNVTINETQRTISAKISKINPEIDSVSQTVKIVGSLVMPEPTLLPGMSGQANFPEIPSTKTLESGV